jgi:hypothetical protein
MPVAFSRRHMRLIQTTEYMVSEKSDGLRYMLLINSSGTYLFDRNFEFSLVHGYDVLTQLFAANEVTVLDGELVRHQKSSRPMFLIFDAVVIDGSPVGSKKLNERLDAVRTKVIEPYRAAVEQQRIDESKVPFMLIGKAFHAKKHLGTLFSHVKRNESGDRVYVDNRRNHKTDGVIFTPVNSPYRPTPAAPILKWKFVDKLSADLKIMFDARQQKWCLYCTGDRHTDIEVRSVEFSPEDTARLSDDIRQRPNSDGTYVIECTYDIWAGRWHYASIRADKKQGNNVRTVFDTLEVIAENITEQELCYRVPRAPQDDHWQARMTDAMQRMNQSAAAGNISFGGGGGSARHTRSTITASDHRRHPRCSDLRDITHQPRRAVTQQQNHKFSRNQRTQNSTRNDCNHKLTTHRRSMCSDGVEQRLLRHTLAADQRDALEQRQRAELGVKHVALKRQHQLANQLIREPEAAVGVQLAQPAHLAKQLAEQHRR